MNYTEKEIEKLKKTVDSFNKYKISYYSLETGMEGNADMFPEALIMAHSEEQAIYIYNIMMSGRFFNMSFNDFKKRDDVYIYWGISIEKIN